MGVVQKERQLQRQLQTLRTDLDKQSLRASEAEAAQQCLQERVQGLQKEANEKDGLYHAKCKELSVAKIRGGPSGIGMSPPVCHFPSTQTRLCMFHLAADICRS